MSEQDCPTCGPTTVEQHPRQPVTRCGNCKEWLTSVPPTQPPAAKCDYCDQRATTLAGDTNGVLVCEDHVRLFAEREIAAAIDATQPPAAPETEADANGLTEAEWAALTRCDCGHDIGGEHNSYGCYGGGPACGCNETDDRPGVNFAAVERIVAERVRVVEGERDAWKLRTEQGYRRRSEIEEILDEVLGEEEDDGAGQGLVADVRLAFDRLASRVATAEAERDHWKDHAEEAGRGFERVCLDYAQVSARASAATARAESAEAAHAEAEQHIVQLTESRDRAEAAHERLQAAVEALADEWAEDYPGPTAACSRTADEWARDLRALLAGGEER